MNAASIGKNDSGHGQAEYLLLTELCTGGQLVDVINKKERLKVDQILPCFYQICSAVQHMHDQKPPIIHRDLKVIKKHFIILQSKATFNQYFRHSRSKMCLLVQVAI